MPVLRLAGGGYLWDRPRCITWAIFCCASLLSLVFADEPNTLEPLMVTADSTLLSAGTAAQRWATTELGELPASPANSYLDLLGTAAGAYAGNPSIGTFSLRGLNQDTLFLSQGIASNPLITVLEDGAPLSVRTLRYLPPLRWELAGAELRRGPQLLQAGPAALGGTLELHGTAPGFTRDGRCLMEIAGHGGYRGGLAQEFILRPDEWVMRFSAYHQESAGEVTNLVDGNDEFAATRRDRYQARIVWLPARSRDAQLDLSLVHDIFHGNPFGTARAVSGYDLFDRKTALNTDPSFSARRDAAILNARLELPRELEFKSTTALQRLAVDQYLDFDQDAVLAWVADGDIDERRVTQDFSLGRAEGSLAWVLGGYGEVSSYDMHYTGVGIAPVPSGSPFDSLGTEDVRVLAFYGRGDWEFADRFHLRGGLRFQHEKRELLAVTTLGPQPESRSATTRDGSALLPQIGLEWRPQDTSSVNLQLSRGYRGGGVSYAPSFASTQPYDPESSWDLELNSQTRCLDSLTLSAALFYSWMEDQQVTLNSPGGLSGIDTYVTNAGRSRRYGGELKARWQPGPPLALSASLGWVRSEFDELTLDGVDRSGQAFPNAPEWTASLGADYRHESGVFSSLRFVWADRTYTDPASPRVTALECRRLLSAQLGYKWDHARVYLFGSNLLDDDYAVARFDNSATGQPLSGQIGPSRCLGIGCEFEW